MIDDFIYISDDAYNREDVIQMEMEILKVLKFNLNYPLSYSFLRRFARCSSQSIETLTLARYILESSLLEYSMIDEYDSKMAAASLLLALKMKNLAWVYLLLPSCYCNLLNAIIICFLEPDSRVLFGLHRIRIEWSDEKTERSDIETKQVWNRSQQIFGQVSQFYPIQKLRKPSFCFRVFFHVAKIKPLDL